MKFFPEEIRLGLDKQLLSANKSFTLASSVRKLTNASLISELNSMLISEKYNITKASFNDLYYVETILCSTGMNSNTDAFGPEELWRARHTPIDKPMNIAHIPDLVCGHMTKSWMLGEDKTQIIPDGTPENMLPFMMHLACSGVLYKELDSEYKPQIHETILAIESGEMFVSMECHFEDFDYALFHDESGELKVIARNEETSWLSAMLIWCGGDGYWEMTDENGIKKNYRLGRYLKGITFTGKGFVKNPANVDSIILNKSFEPLAAAALVKSQAPIVRTCANSLGIGTLTIKRTKTMSEQQITVSELADLKVKALMAQKTEDENRELKAQIEKKESALQALKTQSDKFELSNKDYERVIEAERAESKKKDEALKAANDEKASLQQQLEAAVKEKDNEKSKCETLEKELSEIKAAQNVAERTASLVKEGVDANEAEAFVKVWHNATAEQFASVSKTYIESHTAKAALEQIKKQGNADAKKALESLTPDAGQIPMSGGVSQDAVAGSAAGSRIATLLGPAPKMGAAKEKP